MDYNRVFHVLHFEVSLGQTQAAIFLADDVFAVSFAGWFHHVRKNHGELARTNNRRRQPGCPGEWLVAGQCRPCGFPSADCFWDKGFPPVAVLNPGLGGEEECR
jgi:hypothetical protein